MAIDGALMQHPADLADPVVDVHFGTTQAQRRFTAHRDAMGALSTVETAVRDIAHLVGIPTPEHLVDKVIIVGRLVARINAFEPVPVLDKDLLEDVPVLRGGCNHQGAPREGVGIVVVQLFYHTSPAQSTLSAAFAGARSPTSLTLEPRGLQGNPQMEIPIRSRTTERPFRTKKASASRTRPHAGCSI